MAMPLGFKACDMVTRWIVTDLFLWTVPWRSGQSCYSSSRKVWMGPNLLEMFVYICLTDTQNGFSSKKKTRSAWHT